MKFRLLSSGCETRPARGEPARAGSEPCDGLGNESGEAYAREHVGRGYVASKAMLFRMPSVLSARPGLEEQNPARERVMSDTR